MVVTMVMPVTAPAFYNTGTKAYSYCKQKQNIFNCFHDKVFLCVQVRPFLL
jgi:hypothetical protein